MTQARAQNIRRRGRRPVRTYAASGISPSLPAKPAIRFQLQPSPMDISVPAPASRSNCPWPRRHSRLIGGQHSLPTPFQLE